MTLEQVKSNDYYLPNQIDTVLELLGEVEFIQNNKKLEYANIPNSFDIETTSFYQSNQLDSKTAIMYEWTLNLNGFIIIGRYWDEFLDVINKLSEHFNLFENRRMIIYIHNFSYEFQFMKKRFNWLKVFALKQREPIKGIIEQGIEFRCSYVLSGYKLAILAKQLIKYKCEKLSGDLDYKILRNSKTPLTDKELGYCINDSKVVVCYIQELIERLGNITKIPLTKTGFVRKHCRDNCLYEKSSHNCNSIKFNKYHKLMQSLTLSSEVYLQCKRAFQGGFTHASAFYSCEVIHNVDSFDFTSSYPYVMVSEKFPMSKAEKVIIRNDNDFKFNLTNYCCIFDIEFDNIEPIVYFENYISKSKCLDLKNPVENNGRIVSATHLKTTITEQDYFIIRKMYKWKSMRITNFIRFRKAYLPKDFVLSILQLYVDKTELKDIFEKIAEYMSAKEKVNACYGMTVTDICRDEIIYENDTDWSKAEPNIDDALVAYNKSIKRFLYYPWGIWVTAYARRNLFTGILEFGKDYIYSDTDSIKVINADKHQQYIEDYNKNVILKLKTAMDYHKINFNMTCPKNVKGVKKQLGIWDKETDKFQYTKFKTLGAKRYLIEQNCKYKLTVSGLNKSITVPYLQKMYGDKIFDKFNEELYIPAEYTGKLTHTYIDEERTGYLKDYLGNIEYYEELSCVHLEPSSYDFSLADSYVKYLLDIKLKEK